MASFFTPAIFNNYPEVIAVHSLRDESLPGLNTILAKGTTEEIAAENRDRLADGLGFAHDRVAVPREVHGDTVIELIDSYTFDDRPEGDALITNKRGWLIGGTVADCITVLLYDPKQHAIAAIHSGRRGSAANITSKAIANMHQAYETESADLIAYVSPSPRQNEYRVSDEIAAEYDEKYIARSDDGPYYDNEAVVRDQLRAAGVTAEHTEIDQRSTIRDTQFHSYRRDRDAAGRMIVGIGLHT